jgi:hypothetical protein
MSGMFMPLGDTLVSPSQPQLRKKGLWGNETYLLVTEAGKNILCVLLVDKMI